MIDTKGSKKIQARLDEISMRPELQVRAGIDDETREAYEAALREDPASLPPVLLFPFGEDLLLVDGFHRAYAALGAGLETMPARILVPQTDEPQAEALSLALKANRAHGLRLRPADKRRAVELALAHPWLDGESDRRIAEWVGCSHAYVGQIRRAAERDTDSEVAPQAAPERAQARNEEPPELLDEPEAPNGPHSAPHEEAPEVDAELEALHEAQGLLRDAHARLVQLHQATGLPAIKDAFLVLNTARRQIDREVEARSG